MTVSVTETSIDRPGNGVATEFSVPFRVLQAADLRLTLIADATQAETPQMLDTHYSVTVLAEGAIAVMNTAPPTGYTLRIESAAAYTQPDTLRTQGQYDPRTVERMFDRVTTLVNQLRRDYLSRADFITELEDYAALPADAAIRSDLASSSAGKGGFLVRFIGEGVGAIARWFTDKAREVISPEDYGCVGDGVTDDTVNMQKALDALAVMGGGTLAFPRRKTYLLGALTIGGNTRLVLNRSTLKAKASLATNATFLLNKNFGGAVNTTTDDGILIENGTFDATLLTADRTVELISFLKCGSLTLRRVKVTGPKYIGVALGGCKNARIIDCEFTGTGKSAVTAEGGAALWLGTYGGDGSTTEGTQVIRPYIHETEWAAIYVTGSVKTTIRDPRISNVKEAGIFGEANQLSVSGGFIDTVTRKNISGAGVELGGDYIHIEGVTINDPANCGISLTDTQHVTIVGNKIRNSRREAAYFTTAGHISVLSTVASPNQPRDIKISNNLCIDYSSPATAGIRVEGSGAGAAIINLDVSGNHLQGTSWTTGKAVYINPTYWTAASCSHRDNLGNDDSATGCTATHSVAESLTTAVAKVLTLGAATPNSTGPTGTAMWVVGSPTRVTCHEAGRVIVTGQVAFTGAAGGTRQVSVLKNGAVTYAGCPKAVQASSGAAYTQQVNVASGVLDVSAGDYFELQALQDSGGALNTAAGISQTWLAVRYV